MIRECGMCGIVGIRLKNRNPGLYGVLGELVAPMLDVLASRGPDSTGVAIYCHDAPAGAMKYSLGAPAADYAWPGYVVALEARAGVLPVAFRPTGRGAGIATPLGAEEGPRPRNEV